MAQCVKVLAPKFNPWVATIGHKCLPCMCPWRLEEKVRSPKAGTTSNYEKSEVGLGSLQE